MPVILDYRNTIQNFIHESGRSVWAKDLVAAAVTNNGCLTDNRILLICEDIENGVTSPSIALPGNIGSAIPRIELKTLKHVANVNRLVPNQTIHFCHDGITVLFGANGSGKSGYFRILNKLASGSINYSVMQDIFNENPQPMSIEVTYAENGTDHTDAWDLISPLSTPLGHISVFDTNYAKGLTNEHDSNIYLFDSMGLNIYRGIADGVRRLKELGYDVSSDEADVNNLCTANYSDKLVRALEIQFREELKGFEMDYLNVSLQLSDITNPLSKIKLTIKNNHELDVVLSEAEQKCCALALFIAECELLDVKQPVIFDDPVNSLDACVIGMFANRIVQMSSPIILFTHNTQLLAEIKYADNVDLYKDSSSTRRAGKRGVLIYEVLRNCPEEVGYIVKRFNNMAAINDLIARIQDPDLRQRIEKEVKELTKQKKFGLVFENHIPEMTLLYDYPISRGCKVIRKSDDDKKLKKKGHTTYSFNAIRNCDRGKGSYITKSIVRNRRYRIRNCY